METTEKKVSELKWFVVETDRHGSFMDHGWGNGYVCLPEGHPCYGMDYDEIHNQYEINVNGGLTFASGSDRLRENGWRKESLPDGKWWVVGFDTAHYGDSLSMWPKSSVEHETKKLMQQFQDLKKATE